MESFSIRFRWRLNWIGTFVNSRNINEIVVFDTPNDFHHSHERLELVAKMSPGNWRIRMILSYFFVFSGKNWNKSLNNLQSFWFSSFPYFTRKNFLFEIVHFLWKISCKWVFAPNREQEPTLKPRLLLLFVLLVANCCIHQAYRLISKVFIYLPEWLSDQFPTYLVLSTSNQKELEFSRISFHTFLFANFQIKDEDMQCSF